MPASAASASGVTLSRASGCRAKVPVPRHGASSSTAPTERTGGRRASATIGCSRPLPARAEDCRARRCTRCRLTSAATTSRASRPSAMRLARRATQRRRRPSRRRAGRHTRRAAPAPGPAPETRPRHTPAALRATPVGHQPGAVRRRLDRDAGRSPKRLQRRRRFARAGWRTRRGPACCSIRSSAAGLFRTEALEPTLHQPERVGVTPGERFRIREPGTRSAAAAMARAASQASQHRVHEARRPAARRPPCASATLVSTAACAGTRSSDRELIGAETEHVLKLAGHAGPSAGHQRREPGIERLLSPRAPPRPSRARAGDRLIQRPSAPPAPRRAAARADLREHVEGRSPRVPGALPRSSRPARPRERYTTGPIAYASMPRSGEDGTATSRRGIRPARYAAGRRRPRVPHGPRHGHRIPGLGQRRVHQDAVDALLHGEAGIRCGPDAGIDDDRAPRAAA